MPPKYTPSPRFTKEEVIRDKRLGVRFFDEALTNVSRTELIREAMGIFRNNPGVWNPGWSNFDWALGNAVRDHIRRQGDVPMTFNADEVLSDRELVYLSVHLQINTPYIPTWARRQPKEPGKTRTRKPKPKPEPKPVPMTVWERLLED